MENNISLWIIFFISIAGTLFSGYLSFNELKSKFCSIKSCSQTLFKIPVCVYGLIMYLLVLIITSLALFYS